MRELYRYYFSCIQHIYVSFFNPEVVIGVSLNLSETPIFETLLLISVKLNIFIVNSPLGDSAAEASWRHGKTGPGVKRWVTYKGKWNQGLHRPITECLSAPSGEESSSFVSSSAILISSPSPYRH